MEASLIRSRLAERQEPLRIGLVGAGAMGKGILYQTLMTPGVDCVVLADLSEDALASCVNDFSLEATRVDDADGALRAIGNGKLAVCTDGMIAARCPDVDILVEASSAIEAGARFVVTAIEHGQHVVLMNAEIDLLFGPYFLELARQHGVHVTSCDGDQHGVLKRLMDDMVLWGFEPVMAGNIKGYLDRYADPVMIKPEADKRRLDYKMCTAYTDGSKLCIEMAILANALDMETAVPGMMGPKAASVDEVLSLYDFDALRARGKPVVDYILGAQPGGGVFAVGYQDHPFQSFMMDYYKMGAGPYYTFYRPYHLCHVESIASIVGPVLLDTPLLEPNAGFRTNVFAYAKKDLKAGETLDGIGGHCCYGLIENTREARPSALPLGLTEGVTLTRDLAKDQPLGMADVDAPTYRRDFVYYERALAASATRTPNHTPRLAETG